MVVDLLDYVDGPSLFYAFGWGILELCWRGRLRRRRLVFELDGLDPASLNWRPTCLNVSSF